MLLEIFLGLDHPPGARCSLVVRMMHDEDDGRIHFLLVFQDHVSEQQRQRQKKRMEGQILQEGNEQGTGRFEQQMLFVVDIH